MSLVSRLERHLRRFAIPNLTMVLIAGQAALYVASFLPQGIDASRIALIPERVLAGEIWRLVTFLFTPPATRPLFVIFYFLLFHMIGTTLEQQWGALRYNLFVGVGWLANVAAAFIAWGVVGTIGENLRGAEGDSDLASNVFLYSSLFLAFARLYPDFILNILFVLPIRIKWLALIQWLGYGYVVLVGPWMARLLVLATVLNYLLFFGREHVRDVRQGRRRRSFQAAAKKTTATVRHVCRICGLSSNDSPRTAFRYCSKCEGQQCYCPDHIRAHEHVTAESPAAGS
ncbi:MAG TPA: hypothetical protein VEQ85_12210 [Lacipirellulaceae bacterium]|nr:hypothetical protein [Lacipirellulaceae bacterium]